MGAPASVVGLVEKFQQESDFLRAASTKEHLVRRAYIDPLFSALGWDLDYSEQGPLIRREVVEEDALRVEGAMKAPDYGFYLGGQRRFFVEAKKPSVNLHDGGRAAAFQVRRYGWSAGLPLSIITDFEEFGVYDCRVRPDPDDGASTARTMFMTYEEYPDRWDEVADLFSREAVLSGSLEAFGQERARRGTSPVDKAFLAEIEGWRELLAREIYRRNRWLSRRDLNYAVQMTIDRLVFLRICEDRGIEDYGRLGELLDRDGVYGELLGVFRDADDRYNSGLFHFREERGREESPDGLTPDLEIDDAPLKRIIRRLYYPKSPYQFSVMPVEILGQVYEQFLGKVITITPRDSAVIEEKPEVRKAGGVFYTPAYIVDRIVEKTIGKLVEGKTPRQVSNLRIVDPACGSGSFLVGAYDYLLDWHRRWYVADGPEKHRKVLYEGPGGEWRLVNEEKRRILKNNIHGVDIDPQAVEVTKLSLLLKVLEGETDQSVTRQLSGMQERALPDLDDNIKWGNSLIGPDFYDKTQASLLGEEEEYRINVFPWEDAFPEVFGGRNPGFDAVIGNPPYIRIQSLKEFAPIEVEYYKEAYRTAARGNYDIYVAFVEKGLSLLNHNGRLGFILPHKFFNAQYGVTLRAMISEGRHLAGLVHFGDKQVFAGATTYTCLMFLTKSSNKEFSFQKADDLVAWRIKGEVREGKVRSERVTDNPWNFFAGPGAPLATRLTSHYPSLEEVASIYVGVQTSADNVFILTGEETGNDHVTCYSKSLGRLVTLEKSGLLPIVSGTDVKRYAPLPARQWVIFPYDVVGGAVTLKPWSDILERTPAVAAYLEENEAVLRGRERRKFDDSQWYRFGRNQNIGIQTQRKLCVPRLVESLETTVDQGGSFCLDNVDVNGVRLRETQGPTSLSYLAGVLNSRLARWLFPQVSAPFRGGFWSANRQFLGQLPIRTIDFSVPREKDVHHQVVNLVERMTSLQLRLSAARSPNDRNLLQRQIRATDQQIDRLVYNLYGLTDEEIEVVENETAPGA